MPAKKKSAAKEDAPSAPAEFEPSDFGVGPDDPTYQKPAPVGERPDTPEERRDAVLKDQEKMRQG